MSIHASNICQESSIHQRCSRGRKQEQTTPSEDWLSPGGTDTANRQTLPHMTGGEGRRLGQLTVVLREFTERRQGAGLAVHGERAFDGTRCVCKTELYRMNGPSSGSPSGLWR